MVWMTVKDAAEALKITRRSVDRKVQSGELGEKRDKDVRMVWVAPSSEDLHRSERERWAGLFEEQSKAIALLSSELEGLKEAVKAEPRTRTSVSRTPTSKPRTRASKVKTKASKPRTSMSKPRRILPARHAELLRMVEESGMTLREIEAQAGLSKRFLTKAKLGQRSGPRSQKSWASLEAYLRKALAKTA